MGQDEVFKYLKKYGRGTIRDIADEYEVSVGAIKNAMWRMMKHGEVKPVDWVIHGNVSCKVYQLKRRTNPITRFIQYIRRKRKGKWG